MWACRGRSVAVAGGDIIIGLSGEVVSGAYEQARNRTADPIRWTFTNEKARAKLHRLYPSNPS